MQQHKSWLLGRAGGSLLRISHFPGIIKSAGLSAENKRKRYPGEGRNPYVPATRLGWQDAFDFDWHGCLNISHVSSNYFVLGLSSYSYCSLRFPNTRLVWRKYILCTASSPCARDLHQDYTSHVHSTTAMSNSLLPKGFQSLLCFHRHLFQ